MKLNDPAFLQTFNNLRQSLLDLRGPGGYWEGELSTSALSTATAVCALSVAGGRGFKSSIGKGLNWLSETINTDGGWGDTVKSKSNLSTTILCKAAFEAAGEIAGRHKKTLELVDNYLVSNAGGTAPEQIAEAIYNRYGRDMTFSVPILTMCAISGLLGKGENAWKQVKPLPFELAVFPHGLFKFLRLPVVSYALPALVAIGLSRFANLPPRNPLTKLIRHFARNRSFEVLRKIQPESGGFLEAVPLTSFVVMSLVSAGLRERGAVTAGLGFILTSQKNGGGWPIDKNLSTWLTTLSIKALCTGQESLETLLGKKETVLIEKWILNQQYTKIHPYTHAAPGGWAWTDLPGGVPDSDDTAGALLALSKLNLKDKKVLEAASLGASWLLNLQNSDGGIPTFCRGWGHLPFDMSGTDITAHALSGITVWQKYFSPILQKKIRKGINKGIGYLAQMQRSDGSWIPLWFGNENTAGEINPLYGTSRVVTALKHLSTYSNYGVADQLEKGIKWIVSAQNADGGWGGSAGGSPSSIEETSLAVEALSDATITGKNTKLIPAILKGVEWLVEHTNKGKSMDPAPIGFYFAKLWYFEKLYPVIFSTAALGKAIGLTKL